MKSSEVKFKKQWDRAISVLFGDDALIELYNRDSKYVIKPQKCKTPLDIAISTYGECAEEEEWIAHDIMQAVADGVVHVEKDGTVTCDDGTDMAQYIEYCKNLTDFCYEVKDIATEYTKWYQDELAKALGYVDNVYREIAEKYPTTPMADTAEPPHDLIEKFLAYEDEPANSYYYIDFEYDKCDADYDNTSTDYIDGHVSNELLIKLVIAANFRSLTRYQGEWFNLSALQSFLEENIDSGMFFDVYNRFKICGITIHGYDKETRKYYEVDVNGISFNDLLESGVIDPSVHTIDEAYDVYIRGYKIVEVDDE